ncbi:MAG: hypothetical protein FWF42_03600 [Streptococcaceae bacterium]|nr:hypothetical protein [Streptococcaceae bacterium]MCL2858756.1 hypothetical protein [Streptococcaceae bacterium]
MDNLINEIGKTNLMIGVGVVLFILLSISLLITIIAKEAARKKEYEEELFRLQAKKEIGHQLSESEAYRLYELQRKVKDIDETRANRARYNSMNNRNNRFF